MITLGLANIVPNRKFQMAVDAAFAPANTNASLALAETASWCSRNPSLGEKLRSSSLDPSAMLQAPRFEELGIDNFVTAKRYSYRQATEMIILGRSEMLHDASVQI